MSYREFTKAKVLSIDTETTGIVPWKGDQPFAISFFNMDGEALYFEWDVCPFTRTVFPNKLELELCADILGNKKIRKIFFNAKFDIRMMEEGHGIETVFPIDDAMFMSHVFNSAERHALKPLSEKYLNYSRDDLQDLKRATIRCRRQAKKLGWQRHEDVEADYWMDHLLNPKSKLCQIYCINDTERTTLLEMFYKEALEDLDLMHVYEREMELWPVTYKMESRGIRTDLSIVDREIINHQKAVECWRAIVEKVAWPEFDIESPQQCGKVIYNILGLPIKRRTSPSKRFPQGQPQVNVDALYEHVGHPVVKALFKYRASSKALSNFFLKYRQFIRRDTIVDGWVLHPDFNQVGPATGRYSCRRPNFQNVADALTTRSPEPIQAREPFGPREGYDWYHFDWSGQEPRIFADVSQEQILLNAIKAGLDIHTFTANKAWGGKDNPKALDAATHALELDGTGTGQNSDVAQLWRGYDIKKLSGLDDDNKILIAADWLEKFDWDIEQAEASIHKKTCRARAKMIFFAKIFGGGAGAIMDLLKCGYIEALQFLEDYAELYPRIDEYIAELSHEAKVNGYITNVFGRRLVVSRDKPYIAVNYMVQGSAADMIKIAMPRVDNYLKEIELNIHQVMTVHDELIYETWKKHAFKSVLLHIKGIMEDYRDVFSIDMPVDVEKCVKRWNEKTKIKLAA